MKNTKLANEIKKRLVIYPLAIIFSLIGAIVIVLIGGSNTHKEKMSNAVQYKDFIYFADAEAMKVWSPEALKAVDEAVELVEPEVIDSFVKNGNVVLLEATDDLGDNVGDYGTTGQTLQFEKSIEIARNNEDVVYLKHTVLHEFGHYIDNVSGFKKQNNSIINNYFKNGSNNNCYREYSYTTKHEYFADSYAAYKLGNDKTYDSRQISKEVKTIVNNTFKNGYKKTNLFLTTIKEFYELGLDKVMN